MALSGKRGQVIQSSSSLRLLIHSVNAGDVIIVVSQSGRWDNVARNLAPFQAKGCYVIGITSRATSVIANAADLVLLTHARDLTMGEEPFTLRAAQTMLIDMLVLEVAIRTQRVPFAWEEPKLALQGPEAAEVKR